MNVFGGDIDMKKDFDGSDVGGWILDSVGVCNLISIDSKVDAVGVILFGAVVIRSQGKVGMWPWGF